MHRSYSFHSPGRIILNNRHNDCLPHLPQGRRLLWPKIKAYLINFGNTFEVCSSMSIILVRLRSSSSKWTFILNRLLFKKWYQHLKNEHQNIVNLGNKNLPSHLSAYEDWFIANQNCSTNARGCSYRQPCPRSIYPGIQTHLPSSNFEWGSTQPRLPADWS